MQDLAPLLLKLEQAKFSGKLVLHLSTGRIDSARLSHHLATAEFSRPLPVVENAPGQTCTSGHCKHDCHGAEKIKPKTCPS